MKVSVRVISDNVTPMLVRAARGIPGIAQEAVNVWAQKTRTIALKGIQAKGSSGRKYKVRSIIYVASTAGNYPNSQTGGLVGSIQVNPGSGFAEVGSAKIGAGKRYGLFLEVGTRRMAARPWLVRSLDAAQPEAQRDLEAAVAKLLHP